MHKLMAAGAVLLAVAACVVLVSCEGGEKGKQSTPSQAPGKASGTSEAGKTTAGQAQTLCPVMGGKIDKSVFADYQGKRVYFCCGMCPPKFKAEPEKYLAAMAKEGIVLEKSPEGSQ